MKTRLKLGAHCRGSVTEFCVWAPKVESLRLRCGGYEELIAMERRAGGYFVAEARVGAGTRYEFVFPDGKRRPDPASRAQPEGVHGASMVIVAEPAPPMGVAPLEKHVIYELHVGTFTEEGTFGAIVPRLADLRSLGVTALELMPLAQFPGERNWGYDGVGLFATQWSYGGQAELMKLIRACHEHGLAVIVDVVYNHLGPEGNYLRDFGPYFSESYKTPWGDAINLDGPGSDEVREFFIENALHWIVDCGADGLRLDAVHALHDRSAQPFLAELSERMHAEAAAIGRRALLIAESSDNDPRLVRSANVGGYGLDGCWNDDYHHAVRTSLTGERHGYYRPYGGVSQIAKTINDRYAFAGEFSSNHGRRHGAPARDVPHGRLVAFTQNHDHVGNRPGGERLDVVAGADAARVAAALVLLGPFTPLLWMGEEYRETSPFLYFTSHGDPALIDAVRKGRIAEFSESFAGADPPDPQSVETFARSKLHWGLRNDGGHRELLAYYTELLALRRRYLLDDAGANPLAIEWEGKETVAIVYPSVMLVANTGDGASEVEIPVVGSRELRVVLSTQEKRWGGNGSEVRLHASDGFRVETPGRTAAFILHGKQ